MTMKTLALTLSLSLLSFTAAAGELKGVKMADTMNVGGMKIEGRHLMTYDPAKKDWGGWWFESMAPGAMEMHGTADAKMVRLTSGPTPVPGMPEPQVFRSTWTKTGARTAHFVLEMKTGETWTKSIVGDFKR